MSASSSKISCSDIVTCIPVIGVIYGSYRFLLISKVGDAILERGTAGLRRGDKLHKEKVLKEYRKVVGLSYTLHGTLLIIGVIALFALQIYSLQPSFVVKASFGMIFGLGGFSFGMYKIVKINRSLKKIDKSLKEESS